MAQLVMQDTAGWPLATRWQQLVASTASAHQRYDISHLDTGSLAHSQPLAQRQGVCVHTVACCVARQRVTSVVCRGVGERPRRLRDHAGVDVDVAEAVGRSSARAGCTLRPAVSAQVRLHATRGVGDCEGTDAPCA
jgi:hypothetical protein